jgi:hypothetical protein
MVGPHQRWLVAPRRQCQVKGRSPGAAVNFGNGDHRVIPRLAGEVCGPQGEDD